MNRERKLAMHTEGCHCQQNTDKLPVVDALSVSPWNHTFPVVQLFEEMKNDCVSIIKVLSPSRLHLHYAIFDLAAI